MSTTVRGSIRRRLRAFTLVEAVIVVVVLSLVVPMGMHALREGERSRRQGASVARASILASAVLETVLADVCSSEPGLGFGALSSAATYLDTPSTGLYDRLDEVLTPYEAAGFGFTVQIGGLVDSSGVTSGDVDLDVFRIVTVTVTFPGPGGTVLSMPVSVVVGELGA